MVNLPDIKATRFIIGEMVFVSYKEQVGYEINKPKEMIHSKLSYENGIATTVTDQTITIVPKIE